MPEVEQQPKLGQDCASPFEGFSDLHAMTAGKEPALNLCQHHTKSSVTTAERNSASKGVELDKDFDLHVTVGQCDECCKSESQ